MFVFLTDTLYNVCLNEQTKVLMSIRHSEEQVEAPLDSVLESALVGALAKVRAAPMADIRSMWRETGEVEITSNEAEAVVVFVEDALGRGERAEVADLGESELTSLQSLGQLLQSRLLTTQKTK